MTARVLARTSVQLLQAPRTVTVTGEDVKRGYVVVPTPMRIAVRTNAPEGYILAFDTQGEFLKRVRVSGIGPEIQLGSGGGFVQQPGPPRGMRATQLSLTFRFDLMPSARPGVYVWPVNVTAAPM